MTNRMRVLCSCCVACVGILVTNPMWAAPTATFEVSAAIVEGCVVSGGGANGNYGTLDFGTASTLSTDEKTAELIRNQSVSFYCTEGVTLNAAIDGGQNYVNGQRNMIAEDGSGSLISYSIYSDANMATPVGVNENIMIVAEDANQISIPLYGKLKLSGGNPAGRYNDNLTLTVTW